MYQTNALFFYSTCCEDWKKVHMYVLFILYDAVFPSIICIASSTVFTIFDNNSGYEHIRWVGINYNKVACFACLKRESRVLV